MKRKQSINSRVIVFIEEGSQIKKTNIDDLVRIEKMANKLLEKIKPTIYINESGNPSGILTVMSGVPTITFPSNMPNGTIIEITTIKKP